MLEAFGDSQLIVNQMNQEYEIRKPDLLSYYNKAQPLRQNFDICHITHIRRGENIRADPLAGLAVSMVSRPRTEVPQSPGPATVVSIQL
ncbi:hypothetical protein AAC387_Pa02g2205 [Persea americana]